MALSNRLAPEIHSAAGCLASRNDPGAGPGSAVCRDASLRLMPDVAQHPGIVERDDPANHRLPRRRAAQGEKRTAVIAAGEAPKLFSAREVDRRLDAGGKAARCEQADQ